MLQVQVDRDKGENHQKFFWFTMLEVQVEPKYTYKRSRGSAEIRSQIREHKKQHKLEAITWFC